MTKKKESINNEEVIELGEKEKLTEILMCNYYTNQFATYNNNQNKKRNHVG